MQPIQEAIFIKRVNRFVAQVEVEGETREAHVPNSGRCRELLFPGNTVLLQKAPEESKRKTPYTVILAKHHEVWVCLVSVWANVLAKEAATKGLLPELAGFDRWRPEYTWGSSRFDYLLESEDKRCLVEVKGVTLVNEAVGRALFPDAPTARGARHLQELIRAVQEGLQAAVVFVVQQEDANSISPNWEMDAAFSQALVEAEAAGVSMLGLTCSVSKEGIFPLKAVPVRLAKA
ncbi:MAG: DNA/RNA nuclease SfsA [Firmicutes bacterium]|nr:DNA/RNA nuclease SfsA [Bacillota bacterium]